MTPVIYCSLFNEMQLDDTIVKTIETAPDEELKESRDLILRIRRRNLYQVQNLDVILFKYIVSSPSSVCKYVAFLFWIIFSPFL